MSYDRNRAPHRGTDWIGLEFVERERTPESVMEAGIELHLAGLSLSKTATILEKFGVDRHRSTIHKWVEKADFARPVEPRRAVVPAPVVEWCRGKPFLLVDRGPWYNWSLEQLGCRCRKETWGTRSLIESAFFVLKYRLWRFWKRFPYRSSVESTRRWCRAFAAVHNVEVLS